MVLLIPEESSFQLTAYVQSPGWVRVVPWGYLVSKRDGDVWVAPLIPQLFYGATGEQLRTWRQYIPAAGSQVILSRVAGMPEVPREELFWRRLSPAKANKLLSNQQVGGLSLGVVEFLWGLFIGAVFIGAFIWTPLGRAFTVEAIRRGAGVTEAKVREWLEKGEE